MRENRPLLPVTRDHGGNLDWALSQYGGSKRDWIDLSTGISPWSYPIDGVPSEAWQSLPDEQNNIDLETAARMFWSVPEDASVLAAPGASALIANLPKVAQAGRVRIDQPTYNEHQAAFERLGWQIDPSAKDAMVAVHPNNPDGKLWINSELKGHFRIIDESFCDTLPEASLIGEVTRGDTIVLKSFGKFWGLGGLRLGFAIGAEPLIQPLRETLGPWPVSGPALHIGLNALKDQTWTEMHRERLVHASERLDQLMQEKGARLVGGTSLFRLYDVPDATVWQARLAKYHIWSRIFPYSKTWLRLGLPPDHGWTQLERNW